jgi:alpha-galactosidase
MQSKIIDSESAIMKRLPLHAIFLLFAFSLIARMHAAIASTADPASTNAVQTISLSSVGLKKAHQYGFWKLEPGRTFDKNVPTVAGIQDKNGISARGQSIMAFDLHGDALRFSATVGVDDEVKQSFQGPAECLVYGDGKLLWRSGLLKSGQPALTCDLDVQGVMVLELAVEASGDDVSESHIDWLNATLSYSGKKPENIEPPALPSEFEILTPKVAATPRINGPRIFGVRPGSPFLFTIAASGARPMKFSASGLPKGLALDPETGRITGVLKEPGEHTVTLHATNALGSTERGLRIVVGDKISLAPPMGWSSWNCWGDTVDQEKVRRAAHAMVDSGLAQHGFTFINIDDAWQAKRSGSFHALQGNKKFPDMKSLCDEIHNLGLKAGIYSTPWVQSYAGYPGGSSDNAEGAWVKKKEQGHIGKYWFMPNDARQWGAWGFDYLKCDWYPPKPDEAGNVDEALRKSGRDIILSVSCDAPFKDAAGYPAVANSWRTTTDIIDTWQVLSGIAFSQDHWAPFGGPGHWIDPDMMEIGVVGNGEKIHPTHLTPDEQYLHVSMWCLLSAPLILGCDLEKLDEFTKGLITNDEVLDIDQDPLGKPARRLLSEGNVQVWVKDLEDGSKAVGIFNLGRDAAKAEVPWSRIGITGGQSVRDLWRQKDLGEFPDTFQTTVRPHGVVLVKVSPSRK